MSNITILPIENGMKGSQVANNILTTFDYLRAEIYLLRNEIADLKNTAMGGYNGSGGSVYNSSVNVTYNPTTIMSKTDTIVQTFTVEVKVMCGQNELSAGIDNKVTQFSASLKDSEIVSGGMIIAKVSQNINDGALSYTVEVQPNAISDGEFTFYITFNGVTYTQTIPIMILYQETGYSYTQGFFVSTVFKRSSLDSLPTPFGGDYKDPMPNDSSWSDGIPVGTDPLWCSHRRFTSDGKSPQEDTWSTPILAMDSSDLDVCYSALATQTPEADDAPKNHGKQDGDTSIWQWHDTGTVDDIWMATSVKNGNDWGEWSILRIKGENGISSDWKNTIYKSTEDVDGPKTPTAKTTKFIDTNIDDEGKEIKDITDPNYGWHDVPTAEGTWWMSCAYINGETQLVGEGGWSKPVKVSGGAGQAVFVSTVFMRCPTKPSKPIGGSFDQPIPKSLGPNGESWYDGIPADTGEGYSVWSTHRTFTSNDESPQEDEWSEVQLMADTDNFDCCFTSYALGTPGAPSCHGNQDGDTSGYGWHNTGTSADTWMATSYKNKVTAQDSKSVSGWSAWTITKIKGESGADGNYTNYIFKSASGDTLEPPTIKNPNNFVGKSYGEVIDDEGVLNTDECNQDWEDGPGIGTMWWMSCGVIDGSTGKLATESWSTPTKLNGEKGADGSYTEYQYTITANEINHPTAESAWSDSVSAALESFNEISGTSYTEVPSNYYMWMRFRRWYIPDGEKDLIHGNWEYARVTGEKGESGTKMNIAGTKSTVDELFAITSYRWGESTRIKEPVPTDGESWIVNSELWVWTDATDDDITSTTYSTLYYQHKWTNCGTVVGPSGASQYMHIKYAKILDLYDEETGKWYPNQASNTPEDAYYIGILINTDVEAPDGDNYYKLYTWSKFTGADGYGYEFVYKLMNVQEAPEVPTSANTKYDVSGNTWNSENYQKNDFIPSGWTDNPMGVSSGYPWEYMAKRIRTDGVWEPFKGSASDNNKAILYSYYGKDSNREQRQWCAINAKIYREDFPTLEWLSSPPSVSPAENEYVWERTRTVYPAHGASAETYSDWVYLRIGGEKGNTGTGIQLKGSVENYEKLFKNAYNNSDDGYHGEDGYYDENKLSDGDAWTLSGYVWSWASSNDDDDTDEYSKYGTHFRRHHFSNCGKMEGTPGTSNFVHIKYAVRATWHEDTKTYTVDDDSWLTEQLVDNDGEKIGNFIGMYTNSDKDDVGVLSAYTWSPYGGADGIDYEIIYTRTANNINVAVPYIYNEMISAGTETPTITVVKSVDSAGTVTATAQKHYQERDFVPYTASTWDGKQITQYTWTDNPLGTTELLPYEWACKREKKNGNWGIFEGKASETNIAFLYNKYGASAIEIEVEPYTHTFTKLSGNTGTKVETVTVDISAAKDHLAKEITNLIVSANTQTLLSNIEILRITSGTSAGVKFQNKSTLLSGGYLIFTFNADGVTYRKNFEIVIGSDNGKNGINGVNPIIYEIFPTPDGLKYNSAGTCTLNSSEWPIQIYQNSGGTRTLVNYGNSSLTLKYKADGARDYGTGIQTYTSDTSFAALPRNKYTTIGDYVDFYLLDSSDNTLAVHTSHIYKDGLAGAPGKAGKPLRGPRVWTEGEYYQGGADSDNFQDLVIKSGNTENMYLCKLSNSGSTSNQPPNETYWTRTEYTEFTATKILWTDQLKADMMNVVSAQIGKLTVDSLFTSSSSPSGATISISNGQMNIYGVNKDKPNIKIGIVDGMAQFAFYDANGKYLYNLGPDGITKETHTSTDEDNKIIYQYMFAGYSQGSDINMSGKDCSKFLNKSIKLYKYELGYKEIGSVRRYYNTVTAEWDLTDPNDDENYWKIMEGQSINHANGWYVTGQDSYDSYEDFESDCSGEAWWTNKTKPYLPSGDWDYGSVYVYSASSYNDGKLTSDKATSCIIVTDNANNGNITIYCKGEDYYMDEDCTNHV